jgi:FkbM family methyltransferase
MNIKAFIKRLIIHILPASIKYELSKLPVHSKLSFSQEGEDLLLARIFGEKNGFFIDVGAHHPIRFSNTYLFYLKGWRGINIDAMSGSMKAFDSLRPEDINIECSVSDKIEELKFYEFNEPALNTFSEMEAIKKDGLSHFKIVNTKLLQTDTLANILPKYLKEGQTIDFLNIDVEGLDLQVLKSMDWDKYRPKVILVEDLTHNLEFSSENRLVKTYLQQMGYELFAKTFNTLFFKLSE